MRRSSLFAVLIQVIAASTASAQDQCRDVLLYSKESRVEARTLVQSIAYAKMVNEDNYEQAKQRIGAKATILTAPVLGWFTGGFDEFQEQRDRFLSKMSFSYNSSETVQLAESMLPPEAVAAWSQCIRNSKKSGVFAFIYSMSPDQRTVRVKFISYSPSNATTRRVRASQLEGVRSNPLDEHAKDGQLLRQGTKLKAGWEADVVFDRIPCRRFLIRLSTENSADVLLELPWFSDPIVTTYTKELDPKEPIFAVETGDWTGEASFAGLWSQGLDNLTPTGRGDVQGLNVPGAGLIHCHAHAVLYQIRDAQNASSPWTCYTGPFTVQPNSRVYAMMQDDNFADNKQLSPPMTATMTRLPPIPKPPKVCPTTT